MQRAGSGYQTGKQNAKAASCLCTLPPRSGTPRRCARPHACGLEELLGRWSRQCCHKMSPRGRHRDLQSRATAVKPEGAVRYRCTLLPGSPRGREPWPPVAFRYDGTWPCRCSHPIDVCVVAHEAPCECKTACLCYRDGDDASVEVASAAASCIVPGPPTGIHTGGTAGGLLRQRDEAVFMPHSIMVQPRLMLTAPNMSLRLAQCSGCS
jgi:hypothetical protein